MIDNEKIELNSKLTLNKKKNFGEVFTPKDLIEEMLDKLPQSVWIDEKLTWLDPAAGMGNFHECVFGRLMKGLENKIKNVSNRKRHILENMLFFVEFQSESAALIQEIYNPQGKYKLNVFIGDFTTFNQFDFNRNSFDIIIGNPPYQVMHSKDVRKAKNHNLWSLFISKGFEFLSKNGFLLYITPPAWMSPSSDLLSTIFLNNQLHHVNIGECSRWFNGIGSQFSYYLIEKTPIYKETNFKYNFKGGTFINKGEGVSKFKLNKKIKFIPQLPTAEAFSILEKSVFSSLPKYKVEYDSDLHKFTKKDLISDTKDEIFRHKLLHTPTQIVWSKRPHKNEGKIKVFIPLTTYYESILIDRCGNTQGMGYIITSNMKSANAIKKILSSKFYRYIANITRWSNFNVPMVMKLLPLYPADLPIEDNEIYKYFKLNKKEIQQIESMVK
jgi:adenine-specific DNA-methyltransferase